MQLDIKHVADLMGYQFNIPPFQRGYRWERIHIEKLLDDLYEFSESLKKAQLKDQENKKWNKENRGNRITDNYDQIGFYCLQPLAVVNKQPSEDINKKEKKYDLIDGQQRMTTIYLILHYLSSHQKQLPYNNRKDLKESLYSLSFETRSSVFFTNENFVNINTNLSKDNIDFYFITQGYKTIKEWFDNKYKNNTSIENEILKILLPGDYKEGNAAFNEQLHDVRFIWYETPLQKSIQTFNDLNYGKIGLTPTELVKALLFQCDIYDVEDREVARAKTISRSSKWSDMEENLQDSYFWSMLTPDNYSADIHLELVLQFVAEDIDSIMNYSKREGYNKDKGDWFFYIFSDAICDDNFKNNASNNPIQTVAERVEYLWNCIVKVYGVFRNWYSNRALYHMIGLVVYLYCNYINKNDKKAHLDIIKELYNKYRISLKNEFEEYLRQKIGDFVRITSTKEETDKLGNKTKRNKLLDEINYIENPDEIRKILLLFNVDLMINNGEENSRFPFHLINNRKLNSLEHIHPQNLNDEDIKFNDLKKWYDERKNILNSRKSSLPDNKRIILENAIKNLDSNLTNEQTFNNNHLQCQQDLEIIDQEFDDLAGMKGEIMHSLCNMALVDHDTNSALGNKLIDEKRNKLKQLHESGKAYIPIGTWHAFNKHFSDDVKDLKFWTKSDRDAYFEAIRKVYERYTK